MGRRPGPSAGAGRRGDGFGARSWERVVDRELVLDRDGQIRDEVTALFRCNRRTKSYSPRWGERGPNYRPPPLLP